MEQKSAVVLKNLTVVYKNKSVYSDFNAEFKEGVNVILGRSGSGKTTLLKAVSGLVPFSGEIIAQKPAVVFSEPALAPVSVEKNVRMVMTEKDEDFLCNVLESARIADKKDCNAETLSRGEKQRAALARAFASKREIILMDEPFSGLDIGVKIQLQQAFSSLLQNGVKTVVFVTHDVDEALSLADRIYFLDGSPCRLSLAAELTLPQKERDIYDERHNALRRQLQLMFTAEN